MAMFAAAEAGDPATMAAQGKLAIARLSSAERWFRRTVQLEGKDPKAAMYRSADCLNFVVELRGTTQKLIDLIPVTRPEIPPAGTAPAPPKTAKPIRGPMPPIPTATLESAFERWAQSLVMSAEIARKNNSMNGGHK